MVHESMCFTWVQYTHHCKLTIYWHLDNGKSLIYDRKGKDADMLHTFTLPTGRTVLASGVRSIMDTFWHQNFLSAPLCWHLAVAMTSSLFAHIMLSTAKVACASIVIGSPFTSPLIWIIRLPSKRVNFKSCSLMRTVCCAWTRLGCKSDVAMLLRSSFLSKFRFSE